MSRVVVLVILLERLLHQLGLGIFCAFIFVWISYLPMQIIIGTTFC